MWKIIGCNINFSFDDTNKICNNAVDIMTGKRSQLLQFVGLMNSKLFDWYLKLTTEAEVQGGGIQLYVTTLEKTLLKLPITDAILRFKPLIAGLFTSFDLLAIHIVHFTSLLQSFNAIRKKVILHCRIQFNVIVA